MQLHSAHLPQGTPRASAARTCTKNTEHTAHQHQDVVKKPCSNDAIMFSPVPCWKAAGLFPRRYCYIMMYDIMFHIMYDMNYGMNYTTVDAGAADTLATHGIVAPDMHGHAYADICSHMQGKFHSRLSTTPAQGSATQQHANARCCMLLADNQRHKHWPSAMHVMLAWYRAAPQRCSLHATIQAHCA